MIVINIAKLCRRDYGILLLAWKIRASVHSITNRHTKREHPNDMKYRDKKDSRFLCIHSGSDIYGPLCRCRVRILLLGSSE